ncbi:MAG: hypothetical protein GDA46_04905 [Bdellovibrionales bacterium]|nr:hypothetical protein [Bdellovibrionales bacterium]
MHCTTNSVSIHKDFVIARVALERVRKISGDKVFPKSYKEAENLYQEAKKLFKQGESYRVKEYLHKSINTSEKIEFNTFYKQKKEKML